MRRLLLLVIPVLAIGVVTIAAAAPSDPEAQGSIVVARITQPGLPEQITFALSAPPAREESAGGFAYPEDGSIVRFGSGTVGVAAQPGVSSSAQSLVGLLAITLFGGEITVESLNVRATAAAGPANASSDTSASGLTGLTVLGQSVTPTANTQVPLADWGLLDVLPSTADSTLEPPRSAHATVTGIRVRLLAGHGGLAAGSVIELGSAVASATAAGAEESPPQTVAPVAPVKAPPPGRLVAPPSAPREPGKVIPGAPSELVRPAPEVSARLTAGGYVFPVYGPASFGDSFGSPRADLESGWHHGEDIFAPLGSPLLAVADGTVFSVGWNHLGGWRVWLRDRDGNEFYYAHLSAYSPLAVNGRQVKAGDVIGFMGKTGDASGVHLHFEIHPVGMLGLGYDGAVAPYPFLLSWRRAQDVSFTRGRAYLPIDGPRGRGVAPPAGAVLLEADDISQASGLVPGALEQALRGRTRNSARPAQDR